MRNRIYSGWKRRISKLMIASLLILPVSVTAPLASTVKAAGNTYYVDTNGSDTNNGTSFSTPFRTIQQAANVATGGDTVYIRGGTYRETVTPVNSGTSGNPITYQNYNGETVVMSGNDLVTGWTLDSGNIYKAPMAWSLGAGNQVFVDGVMMDEARWPNQTGTMLNPTRATAGAGTDTTHVVDTSLPGGGNFWNGATIWITGGSAWIAMTSTITAYDSVSKKLTFDPLKLTNNSAYNPKSGNKYYLTGIKDALDTQNEWWYDTANSELYLWAPGGGDPSSSTVEAKSRMNAFDLSGKAYITINGIRTVASTIVMDSNTNHVVLDGMVSKYISHNKLNTAANEQTNLGINLDGSYNEIRNSELAYSSGSLVTVKGAYNNVINSYIHDGGYVPDWDGLVNLRGANSLISHNTVSDAGRVTVYFSSPMSANDIQYNNIYNAGWMTDDLGMLYGPNNDGQNTEIHHNFVHDNKATNTKPGIYLDNYTNNFIIHHNVMWNNSGLQLNIPSNYNLVYNNTAWTNATTVQAWGNIFTTDMYGDRIFNNIIKGYDPEVTAYTIHGSEVTSSPGFVNEASRDYHLLSTSPAKDAGIAIPGITDGYVGSAPDIGAYEYGGSDWTAGHNFTSPPSPTYSTPSTPNMNLVQNGGFEYGNLSSWTATDAGNAAVINDNHWVKTANAGMSRSQFFGLKLSGGVDGAEQTITGLQPNTNYVAGGWLRTPAGETAALGVKNFGGTEKSTSSSSSTWTFVKVSFKTGTTNTSATIYFKKTFPGAGEAYFDDAGLVPDSAVYQSIYEFDSFENGLDNWVTSGGTPSLSSAQTHSGSNSYIIKKTSTGLSKTLTPYTTKLSPCGSMTMLQRPTCRLLGLLMMVLPFEVLRSIPRLRQRIIPIV
ncbi:Carbohydrate binding domain-containing protein [Paenibacillus sp. yr247]|uniref:carbohydrate binding domain-containing protein n=1 Tax=Paenibacillus sp. yr247 TaxID=1761880 RepID=UPI0008891B23|nr:carbohydrate binding domain-containing protein [Paenibacillus sp. yr247]SDP13893.1 Carbohydrate binding domain-containing protein [Paenibacillus sp. yr247]